MDPKNIRKKCIICEKEIYRASSKGTKKLRRPRWSITCSKKCSKIYGRLYYYIKNKQK